MDISHCSAAVFTLVRLLSRLIPTEEEGEEKKKAAGLPSDSGESNVLNWQPIYKSAIWTL